MIKIFLILLALFLWSLVAGQNLVPNPSFEDAYTCPQHFNIDPARNFLPHWYNPNRGTPDHFHVCSDSISGIPDNFAGRMYPFSGRAYAGIILRELFDTVYEDIDNIGISREYIQAKLKKTMVQNRIYCVSLYYAHASKSVYSVDALGVAITRDQISTRDAGKIIQVPQVINRPGHIMDNKTQWKELCGIYRARGNERYITIGNFYSNKQTIFVKNTDEFVDSTFVYAYYYIDDVRVFEIENHFECGCNELNSFGMDMMAENYDPETGYNSLNFTKQYLAQLQTKESDENGVKDGPHLKGSDLDSLIAKSGLENDLDGLSDSDLSSLHAYELDSLLNKLGLDFYDSDMFNKLTGLQLFDLLSKYGFGEGYDSFDDDNAVKNLLLSDMSNSDLKNFLAMLGIDFYNSEFFKDMKNSRLQALLLMNLLAKSDFDVSDRYTKDYMAETGFRNPFGSLESVITAEAFQYVSIGDRFTLNKIFFEFDSDELLTASYNELDRLWEILAENYSIKIKIIGHTDNIGSARYNRRLSNNRAESVYNYLSQKGLERERMEYTGMGSSEPIADNKTEEGRAKNRRVEIFIVDI